MNKQKTSDKMAISIYLLIITLNINGQMLTQRTQGG